MTIKFLRSHFDGARKLEVLHKILSLGSGQIVPLQKGINFFFYKNST
jgi:hypothetical protein